MHAMMSDRTARERYLRETPWADERQDFEACEARRVLAATEPRSVSWSDDGMIELPSCHGYTAVYAQLAVHGVADVGAILAEALSAFVGADDPAEYLEVRQ